MNDFSKKIKRINKCRIGWIVLWIMGLLMFSLTEVRNARAHSGHRNILIGTILILVASIDYVCKYYYIYKDSFQKKAGFLWGYIYERPSSLSDILRSHSFDVNKYSGIILRRLLPLQVVSGALLITAGLLDIFTLSDSLITAGICFMIPTIVIYSAGMLAKRNLTHNKTRLQIVFAGLSGFYNFIKAATAIIAAFKVSILITAICSSNIIMKDISNDVVARVSSNSDKYVGTAILSFVLAVFLILDGNFHITRAAKRHVAAVFLVAIFVFAVTMFTYTARNKNVTIYSNEQGFTFTVNKDKTHTDYTLDSVKSFRVYEEDNSIQIELSTDQNTSFKLFAESMDDTEAWNDKYHSDYNYAAELCRKLTEKGITGKLEEKEKLEKSIKDKDEETHQGFIEIVTLLEESGN
ncbi:MAG: hypothetical protein K5750_04255 [Eubacterium sp.]|nr:hypothetical protein [Eubacterium sp.]